MRKRSTRLSILILFGIGICGLAHADIKSEMTQAYTLYKKGAYPQAIDVLSKIKADRADQALIQYWTGLCHSRMQQFDQAIPSFDRAKQLGADVEDLDYEKGQALYATQQLKPASMAFKRSAEKNYKPGASMYYVGYIHQILEDEKSALDAYGKIVKRSDDPDQVKQATLYQVAELHYSKTATLKDLNQRNLQLKTIVLPHYRKTVSFQKGTHVAQQAQTRISQIQAMLGIAGARMRNGTPISERSWSARASQDLKYDSNVITQADQALTQVSNKASYVSKTSGNFKYDFIYDLSWVMSPEVDFNYTIHSNRQIPTVYQNDAFSITPALRNRWEHTWFHQPAALLFDLEFNYLIRDYKQIHKLLFFSRYFNISLGERARIFDFGPTTLTTNMKFYVNQDVGQTALDPGVTLGQTIQTTQTQSLNLQLAYDYNRARNNQNDKMNYRFSPSYSLPNIVPEILPLDLTVSMDFTIVDTREQRTTRGYEKTLGPSLLGRWSISRSASLAANYVYTRNISKDVQNYAYSKHAGSMALNYQF